MTTCPVRSARVKAVRATGAARPVRWPAAPLPPRRLHRPGRRSATPSPSPATAPAGALPVCMSPSRAVDSWSMADVTRILNAIEQGDPHAATQLLPLVYDELRKLAAQKLAGEAPGQTLDATALVHEAYLRLVGPAPEQPWDSRGHFFAAAAEAMRRILV